MQGELELTSKRLLTLWWALLWRFTALMLASCGVTLLLGGLLAVIMIRSGWSSEWYATRAYGRLLTAVLFGSIPVMGVIATRLTLQRNFGAFRLALLPSKAPAAEPAQAVAA
jgi:hypothetical protein